MCINNFLACLLAFYGTTATEVILIELGEVFSFSPAGFYRPSKSGNAGKQTHGHCGELQELGKQMDICVRTVLDVMCSFSFSHELLVFSVFTGKSDTSHLYILRYSSYESIFPIQAGLN